VVKFPGYFDNPIQRPQRRWKIEHRLTQIAGISTDS